MLLKEVCQEVGLTKRAIKFYEEKGLLKVKKDDNGYRQYTKNDVETLRKISVYRKLDIGIKDIETLLKGDDSLLIRIYQEKLAQKQLHDEKLKALELLINEENAVKANEDLDYETVQQAIASLLPGMWGDYLIKHFKPFLAIPIQTPMQKEAFERLLAYCDETTIKVPLLMKVSLKINQAFPTEVKSAEDLIAYYQDMDEASYEALKKQVLQGVKIKTGIWKYHPMFIAQRWFQKELQNKGYNDIFLPALQALSPSYAKYKEAFDRVNERMCTELGLYYDTNYQLVRKK